MEKIKYCLLVLLLNITLLSFNQLSAQSIPSVKDLSGTDVDNMSDSQISGYWERAKSEGYTIDQIETIAGAKGMPAIEIAKLKQRITALRFSSNTNGVANDNEDRTLKPSESSNLEKFGLDGNVPEEFKKNELFGYDFFNNPNITFTPNLNLATPTNYQIGIGDELLVSVWGAAQNSYNLKVDNKGFVRIDNIGPIYINGLSINKATAKVKSHLRKIYGGLNESDSSYTKVYSDVSLVGVRTIQVNIIGEVKVPGTYSLSALSSMLNGLYAAGGPTEKGTFRKIKLIRRGKIVSRFDIYKYLLEGSEAGNKFLQDQDVVIIEPYTSKISVQGNVKRAGVYELLKGETIDDLIRFFGGYTSNAYKERLLLERVNGVEREVLEILPDSNIALRDGDRLNVKSIIERYKNRVSIVGAVYRGGEYELTDQLTLKNLIQKAQGVKENAFTDRGVIYRDIDGVKKEILSFSLNEILTGKKNILLKREDRVEILAKNKLKENYTISINGAVNIPKEIGYIENLTLEDLVIIAGGFKEGADLNIVDVSRRASDGTYKNISKNFRKSLKNGLKLNEGNKFYLKPFDKVSVRYLKGYSKGQQVSIEGEVAYPGNYQITNKSEKISDLLKRAGGLSPYAYVKGITLIRKKSNLSDIEQDKILKNLGKADSLIVVDKINEYRLGVRMDKVLGDEKNSKYDLILQEGDKLVVPSQKETVEIKGEILYPSVLVKYDKTKSLKDYINNSGGFSDTANKKKAYVLYANGEVKGTKSFWFFKNYPKIEPGAIIIVPKKEVKKRVSLGEFIGITSSLATLVLLIRSL